MRLVDDYEADICAIAETWLKPRKAAQIRALTPMGYKFGQFPDLVPVQSMEAELASYTDDLSSWSNCLLIRFSRLSMCFWLKSRTAHFLICIVYRPPSTSLSLFCEEFSDLLQRHRLTSCDTVIMGDFNFKVDLMDGAASEFQSVLNFHRLQQHVSGSTHEDDHTLDLVISHADADLVRDVQVEDPRHFRPLSIVSFKLCGKDLSHTQETAELPGFS